ncbi:hypothetical protein GCM10011490_17480 [Pseudoclavibacter endophyticus]|uniref:Malonyl-CoA decarboxylase C-terminal domain-containing protein n=1 Tax=Pseudoclavibacter endophyticus TaxID=1778590 RepID=A0A6H9WRD9_9MICO|nr:malonyl-CoA decarboxylase family protein [Pseudoclavibacter endophyticus]KAB1648900.1 hypothetical protein F8O04_00920 [Pseudoclavibacter endophyticus]GGA67403.1 hypothetical protein GCM10011490_17480 [Pseudoclavibacter endophyticus]
MTTHPIRPLAHGDTARNATPAAAGHARGVRDPLSLAGQRAALLAGPAAGTRNGEPSRVPDTTSRGLGDATLPSTETRLRAALADEFAPRRLDVRQITAADSDSLLDWLVGHEAVHPIADDAELLRRLNPADRLVYGLFHPALPDEPVAFTSIALTARPSASIGELLATDRVPIDPAEATIAVFYSISTCHAGLRGLGLGRTMLAGALGRVSATLPSIRHTVTLSPAPALRAWLAHAAAEQGDASPPALTQDALAAGKRPPPALLNDVVERFVADAVRHGDAPCDPVARFHLRNGARLDRVLPGADSSAVAFERSFGVMVSYRYDGQAAR